jgi:putative ABC transport system permease protein
MLQELPYQQFLQTGALVSILILISISLAIYPIIKMNIATILSHEK